MSDFEERLAQAKANSLLQALFRSSRLLRDIAVDRKSRTHSGPQPRAAHAALYAHISLKGTRPTVLAEKLGITPQAVAQLVRELAEMGLVERVPDPDDGRARLVRFTRRGRKDILDGFRVFEGVEADLREQLGAEDFDQLVALLQRLEAAAEGL
ncbi:MAG: MarR family winged helix-turn-helix transcriptional regulator [Myxococcota bacterium]